MVRRPSVLALVALVGSAQDRLDTAQKNIETWFDDSMGRVSGGYKRWAQKWTMGLAVSRLACEPCWTDARLHACAGRVECLARLSVDTVEAQVRRLRFILRSY